MTNYSVNFLERPYGKEWQEQSVEDFAFEMEARTRFNTAVTASFVSVEPIKIILKRGATKLAEFSLSYGV